MVEKIEKSRGNGQIFVVATPIGNLEDFSPRAQKTLQDVDLIAAEDTRHSKKLLHHFAITTPLVAYHEHNEVTKAEKLIEKVESGSNLAIISDAGTPLISDPGFRLIHLAVSKGIKVVSIPGPCALVNALACSGLASDQFIFLGFLPAKSQARKKTLHDSLNFSMTVIFYESSHRIMATLNELNELMPMRQMVIARELTKLYEQCIFGTVNYCYEKLKEAPEQQKGEFVLLLAGVEREQNNAEVTLDYEKILKPLLKQLPLKQSVNIASEITGARKNELYELALLIR